MTISSLFIYIGWDIQGQPDCLLSVIFLHLLSLGSGGCVVIVRLSGQVVSLSTATQSNGADMTSICILSWFFWGGDMITVHLLCALLWPRAQGGRQGASLCDTLYLIAITVEPV